MTDVIDKELTVQKIHWSSQPFKSNNEIDDNMVLLLIQVQEDKIFFSDFQTNVILASCPLTDVLCDQDCLSIPSAWLNFRQVSLWQEAPDFHFLQAFALEHLEL